MATYVKKVFVSFGALVICLLPVSATACASNSQDARGVMEVARKAGLKSLFVPVSKNKEQSRYVFHGGSGLVILEAPDYRLMESAREITLDTPNEQERLPDSINGSQETIWNTYLLPGGAVQHTLSLSYDGIFVTVVPKWTTAWSPKSFASTEQQRLTSLRDQERAVTVAKSLNRLQIH